MSSEQTNAELLPCPFCGRSDKLKVTPYRADDDGGAPFDWGFTVLCSAHGFAHNPNRGCGSSGGWGETEAEAIEAWNRRPSRLEAISEAPKPDFMTLAEHLAKVNNGRPVVTRESDGATFVHRDVCIEAMQSLLAHTPPAGHVVVPVEPLDDLLRINDEIMRVAKDGGDVSHLEDDLGEATAIVIKAYRRAMLAALPHNQGGAK